jgi:hypothetical protein
MRGIFGLFIDSVATSHSRRRPWSVGSKVSNKSLVFFINHGETETGSPFCGGGKRSTSQDVVFEDGTT